MYESLHSVPPQCAQAILRYSRLCESTFETVRAARPRSRPVPSVPQAGSHPVPPGPERSHPVPSGPPRSRAPFLPPLCSNASPKFTRSRTSPRRLCEHLTRHTRLTQVCFAEANAPVRKKAFRHAPTQTHRRRGRRRGSGAISPRNSENLIAQCNTTAGV